MKSFDTPLHFMPESQFLSSLKEETPVTRIDTAEFKEWMSWGSALVYWEPEL